jgi:hypothetical protein
MSRRILYMNILEGSGIRVKIDYQWNAQSLAP